jgi:hypothetical protein
MIRHEFLRGLHASYAPRTCLQIGVTDGRDLTGSNARIIGVDPGFTVTSQLPGEVALVTSTSDDFFARPNPIEWFAEGVIDLAVIDGLHEFEFALRDFINIERLAGPTSVVVFDDMLPRSAAAAARDRRTRGWAGDVYKVASVFAKYRPELVVVPIDTEPNGMLLVVGLDPANTTLSDHYDDILGEYTVDDPQLVPHEITHRTTAADPAKLLASPVWADLAAARIAGAVPESIAALAELRGTAAFVWAEPRDTPLPPKATATVKTSAAKRTAAKKTAAKKPAVSKAPPQGTLAATIYRIRKAIKRRL